jgi:hypothetical protein
MDLMEEWARYCEGVATDNVLSLSAYAKKQRMGGEPAVG